MFNARANVFKIGLVKQAKIEKSMQIKNIFRKLVLFVESGNQIQNLSDVFLGFFGWGGIERLF